MTTHRNSSNVLGLSVSKEREAPYDSRHPYAARLVAVATDGSLIVRDDLGDEQACHWLVGSAVQGLSLQAGDEMLVQPLGPGRRSVVLGRIGHLPSSSPDGRCGHVSIEGAESLTLKCGEASIDLRADGKVMVRGEDVLLRAKGTQRIRAGTVSIN